jgi:hypothetical protein
LNSSGEDYIVDITGGTNNSKEGNDHGLEHAYVFTFKSIEDRDYYIEEDPVHTQLKEFIGPYIADLRVVDYQIGTF